ncbi:hypothetical protein EGK65_02815 [Citrobacter farmeri]|nr:hypothetical protein EGK65_02815 [Citrobacter farmeri]
MYSKTAGLVHPLNGGDGQDRRFFLFRP